MCAGYCRAPPAPRRGRSLDLGFAELHVLLRDRVVLLLDQLLGHGARILSRDVIEAGVGAGDQLDFDGGGFRHGKPRSRCVARTYIEIPTRAKAASRRGPRLAGWAAMPSAYHVYRTVPVPAYVEECEANSPWNLPMSATPLASRNSAPAEVS